MTFLRQSSCFTATVLQKLNMQSNFKLHTAAFTAVFSSNHLDEELFLLYPFFTGSFPYCLKLQSKLNVVFINHLPACSFFLKTVFILLQISFLLPPLCPAQAEAPLTEQASLLFSTADVAASAPPSGRQALLRSQIQGQRRRQSAASKGTSL